MENRQEFVARMSGLDSEQEITPEDLEQYYMLFKDTPAEQRKNMIDASTREMIGKAQTRQRNHAYRLMEEGKFPVKLPCGGYLIPQGEGEPYKWK